MEEQRFLPEGWDFTENEQDSEINKRIAELKEAMDNNDTLEGVVTMADEDFNLYVDLEGSKRYAAIVKSKVKLLAFIPAFFNLK